MNWITNLLKCDSLCEWDCCKSSTRATMNRDNFWSRIYEMKNRDYTFDPSDMLMFERVIHLNNESRVRSILSIGLDPENEFDVVGRLENKKSGSTLMLNHKHLKNLLDFLNDYESHILQTLPVPYATGVKYSLHMQQIQPRILELNMNGQSISIDEESLKKMCHMRSYIQRAVSSLEMFGKKCETSFFKLMSHFSYGKTVKEACDLIETQYTQCFLEELTNFHCECLDIPFISEIAMHFEKWFVRCVPHFIDTMMLHENTRLQSFSSITWPHEKASIDVGKLARSGLYYTGVSDFTQCAFCNLTLHQWQPNDDAILEHFKYKPTCSFLLNHENTQNVSDVSKPSEIARMLAVLNKLEPSFDEVDTNTN